MLQQRSSMMVLLAVVLIAILDGVIRAEFNLPTILGESIDMSMDSNTDVSANGLTMGNAKHPWFPASADKINRQDHWEWDDFSRSPMLNRDWWSRDMNGIPALLENMGSPCSSPFDCRIDLVCRDGVCSACESNDECAEMDPIRKCYNMSGGGLSIKVDHRVCTHKTLMDPFTFQDFFVAAMTLTVTTISVPTGTGGGGILVPMFASLGHFSTHSAIPLSKSTILGGALINNILNFMRRHPYRDRPLVAYELVLLMGPGLLSGTVLGVIANGMCPGWLLAILIAGLLAFSAFSTGRKAVEIYQRETSGDDAKKSEDARQEATQAVQSEPLLGSGGLAARSYGATDVEKPLARVEGEDERSAHKRAAEILETERHHDWKAIGALIWTWFCILVVAMTKANAIPSQPFEVVCGSWLFWILALIPLLLFLVTHLLVSGEVARNYEEKVTLGYSFAEGDLHWGGLNIHLYPALGLLCGITAGALGSGGGMLLAPFILELGAIPLVGMATVSFLVLFITMSSTIQYIFVGQLALDYALLFSSMGFLGAALGNLVLNEVVRRTGRSWFLVAIMSALLGVALILMTTISIMDLLEHGAGMRDICEIKM